MLPNPMMKKIITVLLLVALLAGAAPVALAAQMNERTEEDIIREREETQEANLQLTISFLREEMGLNNAATAAILANIDRESSFVHRLAGDYRRSYGLCQWSKGRWKALRTYCRENKLDWTSAEGQLEFLRYDLTENFADMYDFALASCENSEAGAEFACYYFCMYYEAPGGFEDEEPLREQLAVDYYLPLLKELDEAEKAAQEAEEQTQTLPEQPQSQLEQAERHSA